MLQEDADALRKLLSRAINIEERRRIRCVLGDDEESQSSDELYSLQARLNIEGPAAVLDATGGRGEDFARNQSQGFWAERLLRALTGSIRFVYFGLSDPISPLDPKYDATRRKHRYILLTEGKRPDLLVFHASIVQSNPRILQWSQAPLANEDVALLQADALAGVEIKSSLQHYGCRQRFRKKSRVADVSITVKEEEILDLTRWEQDSTLPVVLMQVFVDSIFVMSFQKFLSRRSHSSLEPKTAKKTRFVRVEGNARAFARIDLDEDGFTFNVGKSGAVTRPARWPVAHLSDVEMPNFAALRESYRRKADLQ